MLRAPPRSKGCAPWDGAHRCSMTPNEAINRQVRACFQLLEQGRADAAETQCQGLVERYPAAAWPAALLGHLLRRRGDDERARHLLQTACRLDPNIAPPYCDLALLHSACGEHAQALALASQARQIAPQDPNVYFATGQVFCAAGRVEDAEHAFAQAERLAPGFSTARYELGVTAFGAGRHAAAARHFAAVTRFQPQRLNAWVNLGLSLLRVGDFAASAQALHGATKLAPSDAQVAAHYANALALGGIDADATADAYLRAAALAPDDLALQMRCAAALSEASRHTDLRAVLDRVLALEPDHLLAHWLRVQKPASDVFANATERAAYLDDWRRGMADFERRLDAAPELAQHAAGVLESVTNFHISYFGQSLRDEQRHYASVLRRLVTLAGLTRHEIATRALRPGRRRIGILSRHLYAHSVHKALGEALLDLRQHGFELHVFHTGGADDAVTARWRAAAEVYHAGERRAEAWAQCLRESDLDILVFPDLGMDPLPQALGVLRVAPVQIASWGHPTSSGCATIDYFLSADATEPAEAAEHYTERLVRLPNLGTCFTRPDLPAAAWQDTDTPVLAFAQHPAKLVPEHDGLMAQILAGAPNAQMEIYLSTRNACWPRCASDKTACSPRPVSTRRACATRRASGRRNSPRA